MIRAFLGIAVPDDQRSALAVQQFLLPLPRKVPPEAFHLTLVFLGEVHAHVLEAAHEAFQTLRAERFALSLAGLGLFGADRPRSAWAGICPSRQLNRLQAKVEQLARQAGCPVEHRRFVPHVTLGRFPPPQIEDAMRLERAVAQGASFATPSWEVTALTLWQSHLGAKTPHYEELATYPLAQAGSLGR